MLNVFVMLKNKTFLQKFQIRNVACKTKKNYIFQFLNIMSKLL